MMLTEQPFFEISKKGHHTWNWITADLQFINWPDATGNRWIHAKEGSIGKKHSGCMRMVVSCVRNNG
jgi:hypothetical protein